MNLSASGPDGISFFTKPCWFHLRSRLCTLCWSFDVMISQLKQSSLHVSWFTCIFFPSTPIKSVWCWLASVLNAFTVKWYGEAEFWLSTGKVILILIVFLFTFITMVGGNPKHDAYGFRYWKDPGSFAEHITTGSLGRFEGFLGAVWSASFTVVGPEYISMVAGETKLPRRYLKTAFKTTYARFAFFSLEVHFVWESSFHLMTRHSWTSSQVHPPAQAPLLHHRMLLLWIILVSLFCRISQTLC